MAILRGSAMTMKNLKTNILTKSKENSKLTSTQLAEMFGTSAAYVRAVWRRHGVANPNTNKRCFTGIGPNPNEKIGQNNN
jgi:hypothetical protein